MKSRIPPFKSIEAFVVAARSVSFTEAAATLHLTVPAVSRRIQSIETELGVALFQRTYRTLKLTEAGEAYISYLAPAIDALQRASDQVRGEPGRRSVRLSLPASLAANWLVHRLHRFSAKHGDIKVELQSINGTMDFDKTNVDLAIWLGTGNWPGMRVQRLLDVEASPVCCADFLTRNAGLRTEGDLAKFPLLGIEHQQDLWSEWLRPLGIKAPEGVSYTFDNFHLLYRAAASGLGIALGIDALVKPYLEDAQLVLPFNRWRKLTRGYYVVGRRADWMRRPVAAFRQWLAMEAGSTHAASPGASSHGASSHGKSYDCRPTKAGGGHVGH
jgi:LysR family glycine cleavage system transcriptional activator